MKIVPNQGQEDLCMAGNIRLCNFRVYSRQTFHCLRRLEKYLLKQALFAFFNNSADPEYGIE
jgi:hypothetical protein